MLDHSEKWSTVYCLQLKAKHLTIENENSFDYNFAGKSLNQEK